MTLNWNRDDLEWGTRGVHYDETTPHLHVISVPLTKDGRLSARDVIGNKSKMSKTQDSFFEQVGRG